MDESSIHRFKYILGKNYVSYNIDTEGTNVEDVTIAETDKFGNSTEHNFINGKSVDSMSIVIRNRFKTSGEEDSDESEDQKSQAEEYKLHIYINDKRYNGTFNPNSYFKNLKVWQVDSKKAIIYLFQFDHKYERVNVLVKEPAIVFNGKYYEIRLNMNVLTSTNKEVDELEWFLSSAAPVSLTARSKTKDTPKNIERLKLLKGKSFNIMGVDLGQRTPFAYAIGQTTINSISNDLKILNTGEHVYEDSELGEMYWDLLKDQKSVSKIIGITKGLYSSPDDTKQFSEYSIGPTR
jgi:hypothetical protein